MPKKRKSNGEGTIFQDKKNNRWIGQLSIGRDSKTGKLKRRSWNVI